MKLYISAEMLAVCFHCVKWNCLDAFSAFQRAQRNRAAFIASSLSLSLSSLVRFSSSSSSSGPDDFPQRALFFIVYFFAPHIPTCTLQHHLSEAEPGPGTLVCELRRACFLRERARCSIEQKYAWNSSLSPSIHPHAE